MCMGVLVSVCVCVCVCLLSLYFLSTEVVNAQAKVSGEHAVFFIAIATEVEIRETCKFVMCPVFSPALLSRAGHPP